MIFLVTGGAGFIGSNYVKHLLENGEKVIVLDSFTYAGNPDNLKDHINKENLLMPEKYTFLSNVFVDTQTFDVSLNSTPETVKRRWKYKFSDYKISPELYE